jgi:spore germination cell wall hydrolase CwlJ-like protein
MGNLIKAIFIALIFSTPAHAANKHQTQLMCMAKNIYFEAGAESFEGKLAVGQVVLNRTNHPNYPGSVCDVVFQRTRFICQFSWVCEGKGTVNEKSRNWQESVDAAKYLLTYDMKYDKLNKNVLFFKNKTSPFAWKIYYTKVATIGNHEFYMRKPRNYAYKG